MGGGEATAGLVAIQVKVSARTVTHSGATIAADVLGAESFVGQVRSSLCSVTRSVRLPARAEDVGVVSETVEERGGELLIAEDLHPFAKREVGRDGRRALLVAVGEEVEQQLAAGALEGYEAELVDGQQRDPQVTLMEPRERELVTCLDQFVKGPLASVYPNTSRTRCSPCSSTLRSSRARARALSWALCSRCSAKPPGPAS